MTEGLQVLQSFCLVIVAIAAIIGLWDRRKLKTVDAPPPVTAPIPPPPDQKGHPKVQTHSFPRRLEVMARTDGGWIRHAWVLESDPKLAEYVNNPDYAIRFDGVFINLLTEVI